jgi:hypothetical protein
MPPPHLPGQPGPHSHEHGDSDNARRLGEAAGIDHETLIRMMSPDNPAHGDEGHECLVEAVAGGDAQRFFDLVCDNTPAEWILCSPEEQAERVAEWAEGFRTTLAAHYGLAQPTHEQIVDMLNRMGRTGGKPPVLLMDALGVAASEIDPLLIADNDQKKAEFMAAVREVAPDLAGSGEHEAFDAIVSGAAPDGWVMYEGHFIPEAERDRFEAMKAAEPYDGYSADNPYRAELGKNFFILIEVVPIDGTGVDSIQVRTGNGLRAGLALDLLAGTYRKIKAETLK